MKPVGPIPQNTFLTSSGKWERSFISKFRDELKDGFFFLQQVPTIQQSGNELILIRSLDEVESVLMNLDPDFQNLSVIYKWEENFTKPY